MVPAPPALLTPAPQPQSAADHPQHTAPPNRVQLILPAAPMHGPTLTVSPTGWPSPNIAVRQCKVARVAGAQIVRSSGLIAFAQRSWPSTCWIIKVLT